MYLIGNSLVLVEAGPRADRIVAFTLRRRPTPRFAMAWHG